MRYEAAFLGGGGRTFLLSRTTLRSAETCQRKRRSENVRCAAERPSGEWSVGRVSVLASVVSFGATLTNRLLGSSLAVDAQSRADLLCVASGAMLLLYGIANLDVDSRVEEVVELEGSVVQEISKPDPDGFLGWMCTAIPSSIPNMKSIVICEAGNTVVREGIMGPNPNVTYGPIVLDALATRKRTYFAKLSILPGRLEFDYLPPNTQAVLIQPLSEDAVLILGSDKVRPLASVDFGWLQAIVDRLVASASP